MLMPVQTPLRLQLSGKGLTVGTGFIALTTLDSVPLAGEHEGADVTKRVLVLGLVPSLVDDFRRQLDMPDVELVGGTGMADIRSAFVQGISTTSSWAEG